MLVYDEATINWPDSTLKLTAEFTEHDDYIKFYILIHYASPKYNNGLIYKTWTRKKLGYFDPDTMLQIPDQRLVKIANKFKKMGQNLFNIRFQTLLNRET